MNTRRHVSLLVVMLVCASSGALAQVPGEVPSLTWCTGPKTCLQWTPATAASRYGIYRGVPSALPSLLSTGVDSCDRFAHTNGTSQTALDELPAAFSFFWYLSIAENACARGLAGNATAGPRTVNSSGFCQPYCSDASVDGDETDRDCGGGSCAPCGTGKNCLVPADCASRVCNASVCAAPTCTDIVQNGAETGVDCGGGACPPCSNGQPCCYGSDCQSDFCSGSICILYPCLNGMQDGNETDVDCGGGTCPPCGPGKHCLFPTDCNSGVCTGQICQPPNECPRAAACNGTGVCGPEP